MYHYEVLVTHDLSETLDCLYLASSNGLTPCVSPIVVVPKLSKLNKIRTCVDMRSLNKRFIRKRHIIPTIDDSCKVFCKINLNQENHQIPLHQDLRPLSKFSSHRLFEYKHLHFGLSCAKIFQKKVGMQSVAYPVSRTSGTTSTLGAQTNTIMTDMCDKCSVNSRTVVWQ